MTMLYGWASQKETYPMTFMGDAFQKGVSELDKINRRFIVQGEGGTVLGIGFALKTKNISTKQKELLTQSHQLNPDIGNRIELTKSLETSQYTWFELRGRLTSPESVAITIGELGLNDLLVSGAFGIITARPDTLNPDQLDHTAPIEVLPTMTGGTVGLITNMIKDLPQLGIVRSGQDGRSLLQTIAQAMNHSSGEVTTSAMAQRLYLLRNFAHLAYSLHWAILDLDLHYVHALHSREQGDVPRIYPYLYIGKNEKNGTVAFGSKAGMFDHNLGIMNPEAPDINQVRTIFTHVSKS